jgi:hypothetical protein
MGEVKDAVDNQLNANEFWKILKVRIIAGLPIQFKLEKGIELSYDPQTNIATISPSAPILESGGEL